MTDGNTVWPSRASKFGEIIVQGGITSALLNAVVDTSTLRGGMNETALRYFYYPTRHWGIGVGFDKIAINIPKFDDKKYVVRASYTMQGLSAYLRFAF